eukprot:6491656-Amphidinium_carterae.4
MQQAMISTPTILSQPKQSLYACLRQRALLEHFRSTTEPTTDYFSVQLPADLDELHGLLTDLGQYFDGTPFQLPFAVDAAAAALPLFFKVLKSNPSKQKQVKVSFGARRRLQAQHVAIMLFKPLQVAVIESGERATLSGASYGQTYQDAAAVALLGGLALNDSIKKWTLQDFTFVCNTEEVNTVTAEVLTAVVRGQQPQVGEGVATSLARLQQLGVLEEQHGKWLLCKDSYSRLQHILHLTNPQPAICARSLDEVPVADMSNFELLVNLERQGFLWKPFPHKLADRKALQPHAWHTDKVWYSGPVQLRPLYMQCLLRAKVRTQIEYSISCHSTVNFHRQKNVLRGKDLLPSAVASERLGFVGIPHFGTTDTCYRKFLQHAPDTVPSEWTLAHEMATAETSHQAATSGMEADVGDDDTLRRPAPALDSERPPKKRRMSDTNTRLNHPDLGPEEASSHGEEGPRHDIPSDSDDSFYNELARIMDESLADVPADEAQELPMIPIEATVKADQTVQTIAEQQVPVADNAEDNAEAEAEAVLATYLHLKTKKRGGFTLTPKQAAGRGGLDRRYPDIHIKATGDLHSTFHCTAGRYGGFQASCPFHKKNSRTGCKRFIQVTGAKLQDRRDALLKCLYWCLEARHHHRQRWHVYCEIPPVAALPNVQTLWEQLGDMQRPEPPVLDDDELDDALAVTVAPAPKPKAKPKPKPKGKAAGKAKPQSKSKAKASAGPDGSSSTSSSGRSSSSSSSSSG